jgi:hypothetical protein
MSAFVTLDGDLMYHLQAHATVVLRSPSEHWTALQIPRGTPPHLAASPRSPLARSNVEVTAELT